MSKAPACKWTSQVCGLASLFYSTIKYVAVWQTRRGRGAIARREDRLGNGPAKKAETCWKRCAPG
jgi:hypothetical protein